MAIEMGVKQVGSYKRKYIDISNLSPNTFVGVHRLPDLSPVLRRPKAELSEHLQLAWEARHRKTLEFSGERITHEDLEAIKNEYAKIEDIEAEPIVPVFNTLLFGPPARMYTNYTDEFLYRTEKIDTLAKTGEILGDYDRKYAPTDAEIVALKDKILYGYFGFAPYMGDEYHQLSQACEEQVTSTESTMECKLNQRNKVKFQHYISDCVMTRLMAEDEFLTRSDASILTTCLRKMISSNEYDYLYREWTKESMRNS